MVLSIGYRSDRDRASWCESDEGRYDVEARRAERRTC
jgi:hypothetical protein